MSTGARMQCDACEHFRKRATWADPFTCDAFPAGIPALVLDNVLDHRLEVEGDNGIRFAAKADDEFPAYAFA